MEYVYIYKVNLHRILNKLYFPYCRLNTHRLTKAKIPLEKSIFIYYDIIIIDDKGIERRMCESEREQERVTVRP
jgi:hypothetical protein